MTRTVTSTRDQITEEVRRRLERPANRIEPVQPAPPRERRPRVRTPAGPQRPVDALKVYWPDAGGLAFAIGRGRDLPLDPLAIEPYAAAGSSPMHGAVSVYLPAQPAPAGPAAMIEWLEKRGIRLIPTIDGEFVTTSERGRLALAIREAIEASRPLLRAYVHGSPLRCSLAAHHGAEPPEAVSLALGGAAVCAGCLAGRSA